MSSSAKKKADEEDHLILTGEESSSANVVARSKLSSPLRTLQVARDILARACFSNSKGRPVDCENLHIL